MNKLFTVSLLLLFSFFCQQAFCSDLLEEYRNKPNKRIIPVTMAEQIMYSTVRIKTNTGKGTETATGFIFRFSIDIGPICCVIINLHVLEKASWAKFILHLPDVRTGEPSVKFTKIKVENFSSQLIFHPNPSIDLCGYPLGYILASQIPAKIEPYTRSVE